MSKRKLKSLLLSDDLKELVIELGRITQKNSMISLYLPKRIVKALRLSKNDKYLVIFSIGNDGFFLMKDSVLASSLKPQILELRKRLTASCL